MFFNHIALKYTQKMKRGNEQDDELDMLLGEIPNVTSGANHYLEESGPIYSSSMVAAPLSDNTVRKALHFASLPDYDPASQSSKHGKNDVSWSPGLSSPYISACTGPNYSINSCTNSPTKTANSKGSQNEDILSLADNVGLHKHQKEAGGVSYEPCLPDEQSLTSDFDHLGFKSGLADVPTDAPPVHCRSIPIPCLSLECQCWNHKSSTQSVLEDIGSIFPKSLNGIDCFNLGQSTFEPPGLLNMSRVGTPFAPITNAVDKFAAQMNGEEDSKLLKPNTHDLNNQKLGPLLLVNELASNLVQQRQPLPMHSTTPMPDAAFIHSFQVPPSVSLSGVEYPGSAYDRQFHHSQGPPVVQYQHCGHPKAAAQHLNPSHVMWQHIGDEQQKATHYLYLQPHHNQGARMNNQVQTSCIWPIGSKNGKPNQTYYEFPIPHEMTNQARHWNDGMLLRGIGESNLMLMGSGVSGHYDQHFCRKGDHCTFVHGHNRIESDGLLSSPNSLVVGDLQAMKRLEKSPKQIFPEKILTRSNGLDSLRNLNADSVSANDISVSHANSNSGSVINSHCNHHPLIINGSPFLLGNQISAGCFSDKAECPVPRPRQPLHFTSLDEAKGKIYAFAKDQHGCRLLQEKFVEGNPDHVQKIFVEIIGHIDELMTDPFGNYLVQKLLGVCNEHQIMQILHSITRNAVLVDISLDMHGTRAVQKLIETIKTPDQKNMVVSALVDGVVRLIKDLNGNHVIQRCLQCLEIQYNKFLFDAAVSHCVEIATHRHGCCVLQKCLHHSEGEQRCRLVSEVIRNALILSTDQFGNYVVQYVFELGLSWAEEDMVDRLQGHFAHLSRQKFSSNVVEKCLKSVGEDKKAHIIQELMDYPCFAQLLQDPFANYVVQSALANSKGPIHAAFVDAIKPHAPALRTSTYGKRILSCTSLKGKC